MIEVKEVAFLDMIDRVRAEVLPEHWAEVEEDFGFECRLDTSVYERMQAFDCLICVVAFDSYKIAGYSTAIVLPHPYNPSIVCCNSDTLFVRKAYRNGRTAYRIMQEVERLARQRGANRMMWHTRGKTNFASSLARRGYELSDVIMMKEL